MRTRNIRRVLQILFGAIVFIFTYVAIGSYQFSAVFFTAFFLVFIFTVLYLIDVYLVPEFDTLQEISKGNVAVALYFLALCLIAAAAIIAGSGALGFLATP